MTRHRAEELSALLDDELNPERASQLRSEVASDAMLRAEYEELARIDADLRAMADEASFLPKVELPAERATAWHLPTGVDVTCALVLVRFLPKLCEAVAGGIALQLMAAAIILLTGIRLCRQQSDTVAATI